MPRIANIVEAASRVDCAPDGSAHHIFTVTNITGSSIEIGAQVLADEPARESWFELQGPQERELPANGTDQIEVLAQLPQDAPRGDHTFRLLVFSTRRGRADEDFAEGPKVAVTYTPVEAPQVSAPPPKKAFPWWLLIVVGVVLVAGIAWWLWPSSMEQNTDRAGQDYRSFDLSEANPGLCLTACEMEAQCVAWTFVKPGVQHPTNARCWLKNTVPPPTNNACCTSGVK